MHTQPFKVQRIAQSLSSSISSTNSNDKSLNNNGFDFTLPEVQFLIPSISILNYNSHSLIQIINCMFQNENGSPPYAQIQKCLSIITYSLTNDPILKSDLFSLLQKNIHKKQDLYCLFCLWCKYDSVDNIIDKVFSNENSNKKIIQKVVYVVLNTYLTHSNRNLMWFQNMGLNDQVSKLLGMKVILNNNMSILQEFDGQLVNLNVGSYQKYWLITKKLINLIQSPKPKPQVLTKLKKIFLNFIHKKENLQYIKQFIQKTIFYTFSSLDSTYQSLSISKNHSSLLLFQNILQNTQYVSPSNQNQAQIKDQPQSSLSKITFQLLQNKFNSDEQYQQPNNNFYSMLRNIFSFEIQNYRHYIKFKNIINFLKTNIKTWFITNNNYDFNKAWTFFNRHFILKNCSYTKSIQKDYFEVLEQKRKFILVFMNELSKQNQQTQKSIQKIILSKYLFNFFQSRPFNFKHQLQFLKTLPDSSQSKHIAGQIFPTQKQIISKGLKHIKNQDLVNVMIFNKSHFPSLLYESSFNAYESSTILDKFNISNSVKKALNNKIISSLKNIEEELLKQNKKIQVVYNVLRILIDKKPVCLTLKQFEELMIKYSQNKDINLENYNVKTYHLVYSPLLASKKKHQHSSSGLNKNNTQLEQNSGSNQIHPIIMQARIIKLMKKELKKASALQISKHLSFPLEKTQQTVKKLVTKGYLQQHQGQIYSYQP